MFGLIVFKHIFLKRTAVLHQQLKIISLINELLIHSNTSSIQMFQQKMNYFDEENQQGGPAMKGRRSSIMNDDSVMSKIAKFIDSRQISIFDFWQSDRNCASASDIVNFSKNCGLHLPEYDVINIKSEIFANQETIFVDQFAALVPFWDLQEKNTVAEFLKKRSDLLLDRMQTKDKKRPKSSIPYNKSSTEKSRPFSRQSSMAGFKKEGQTRAILTKNKSKDYLRKHKQRQLFREKQLHDNIEKNKIDEEYGMLLKMSELNSINKERQKKTTYRAYKSAEGVIKVRVFNLNKFEKEISLNEFDTIYKNFKKTTKENKDWTYVPQSHQKPTDELQNLKSRNIQKSERQQQLKNLLVGTVNLTNLLKQQIKIFKEKGILGCDQL